MVVEFLPFRSKMYQDEIDEEKDALVKSPIFAEIKSPVDDRRKESTVIPEGKKKHEQKDNKVADTTTTVTADTTTDEDTTVTDTTLTTTSTTVTSTSTTTTTVNLVVPIEDDNDTSDSSVAPISSEDMQTMLRGRTCSTEKNIFFLKTSKTGSQDSLKIFLHF